MKIITQHPNRLQNTYETTTSETTQETPTDGSIFNARRNYRELYNDTVYVNQFTKTVKL